jgi:vacuolar protein sorting-associated protein 13A/C
VILLENLSLNREGIKKLHLPIEVKHGYIGTLRVSIPWSRLTSESVSIEIQDVFLLANPVDPKSWDPDELRKVNLETKRAMLEKLGQATGGSAGGGGGKDGGNEGYFARLGAKIADNIFIFIKSVHVR